MVQPTDSDSSPSNSSSEIPSSTSRRSLSAIKNGRSMTTTATITNTTTKTKGNMTDMTDMTEKTITSFPSYVSLPPSLPSPPPSSIASEASDPNSPLPSPSYSTITSPTPSSPRVKDFPPSSLKRPTVSHRKPPKPLTILTGPPSVSAPLKLLHKNLRKSPSSPSFKKSASVIYEERTHVIDPDLEEYQEEEYRNGSQIITSSPSRFDNMGGSFSNDDGGSGSPPKYFELMPQSPLGPSMGGQGPMTPLSPTAPSIASSTHPLFHRSPSSRIYYRSVTREESVRSGHPHHHHSRSTRSINGNNNVNKMSDAVDGLTFVMSALYAKILVIIGLCFPMAEVISHRIPIGWYEGFYLYLYLGSVVFLVATYALRLKKPRPNNTKKTPGYAERAWKAVQSWCCWSSTNTNFSPNQGGDVEEQRKATFQIPNSASDSSISNNIVDNGDGADGESNGGGPQHFGSFYLRLGAVAFGIGSMIYSGLEFGQFFELESKEHCYNFLYGFTPSSHMLFTFFQLYFVFVNSKVLISRYQVLARFGLMHMIATNVCVWLHVLIQETKHQIMIVVNPNSTFQLMPELMKSPWSNVDSVVEDLSEDYLETLETDGDGVTSSLITPSSIGSIGSHSISRRSIVDHESVTHGLCRRSNVIGQLVQDASQFLFPCTIEYSLICAAVCYMMWKHTGDDRSPAPTSRHTRLVHSRSGASTSTVNQSYHHQKYHYQVDCAKAHKGLFCGIFLLVVCIISLILFFVLIKKPNYRHIGVLQAHIVELLIYVINAIACLIAAIQIKGLRYNRHRNVELDNILLIIAQAGLIIFNMFSLIGAQFFGHTKNTQLVLINAIACILQATLQTTFILDASRRYCQTPDQIRKKPGREMVTFMLVCNFAMWAINTLETRRADSNPVQMHFYGFWAWTIITHVTTPLTIFYRFHSTVCLCDIWKRVYKLRSDP